MRVGALVVRCGFRRSVATTAQDLHELDTLCARAADLAKSAPGTSETILRERCIAQHSVQCLPSKNKLSSAAQFHVTKLVKCPMNHSTKSFDFAEC